MESTVLYEFIKDAIMQPIWWNIFHRPNKFLIVNLSPEVVPPVKKYWKWGTHARISYLSRKPRVSFATARTCSNIVSLGPESAFHWTQGIFTWPRAFSLIPAHFHMTQSNYTWPPEQLHLTPVFSMRLEHFHLSHFHSGYLLLSSELFHSTQSSTPECFTLLTIDFFHLRSQFIKIYKDLKGLSLTGACQLLTIVCQKYAVESKNSCHFRVYQGPLRVSVANQRFGALFYS